MSSSTMRTGPVKRHTYGVDTANLSRRATRCGLKQRQQPVYGERLVQDGEGVRIDGGAEPFVDVVA